MGTNSDMYIEVLTDRVDELEVALEAMLDWAISNRNTQYEFVVCRSDGDLAAPALVAARAALAPVKGEL